MKPKGISSTRAIAVVLIIVALGAASGFFFTRGSSTAQSTPSVTTTSAKTPPINFTQAYLAHLDAYANRTTCSYSASCVYSLSALNDYNNQSVVAWRGQAVNIFNGPSFAGPRNATGLTEIQALYQGTIQITQTMTFKIQSIRATNNQVDAMMTMSGSSGDLGEYQATLSAQATYSYANGAWSISKEVWDYVSITAPSAVVLGSSG
jgi:hypothetical protein